MPKYVYVGDPKGEPHRSGKNHLRLNTGEQFVFVVGQPVEVPPWVERCVKNNNHYKLVQDAPKPLGLEKDAKSK